MKSFTWIGVCAAAAFFCGCFSLPAGADEPYLEPQPVTPAGDPVLEAPTLTCLGAWWIVPGDDKKEFRVDMDYRKAGDAEWKKSMPMLRVRKGDTTQKTHEAQIVPPDNAWLFAGSIVNLTPGTDYELKLTLVKPDGTKTEKVLKARTNSEPTDPPNPIIKHVVPGKGGGDGSEAKPYLGLEYAETDARPGTIFLIHKGTYEGTFHIVRSGEEGKPVIYRGAGDGEAIIDGGGASKFGVEMTSVHDVRVEKLSIRGFYMAVAVMDSSNLVIRRCNASDIKCGIYCNSIGGRTLLRNIIISDNRLEGPWKWGTPTADVQEWRGVQVTGMGYDVCYNYVRGFRDGIDTFPSKYCAAIDFHHNDVVGCEDDGTEMDYSERNTRCFMNRYTNVHQGISFQPIFGGPTYAFRNVLYNINVEPFKLHHEGGAKNKIDWWPSGAILYHNTVVKKGDPCILYSAGTVYNCFYRNNLFIGGGKRAFSFDAPMNDCDFDYDGFGGGPWDNFLKWNKVFYKTFDEVKAKAPIERHAVMVDAATAFASGVQRPDELSTEFDPAKTDLRLKAGCAAVDAGEVLPGFNDGFTGLGPDLGAYELGSELPHYGPRPEPPAAAEPPAKKPTFQMLVDGNDKPVENPTAEQVAAAVKSLDGDKRAFVILRTDETHFIQANWVEKDRFTFQYEKGDEQDLYETMKQYPADMAVNLLLSYMSGKEDWKKMVKWNLMN